jgi:hypothetical protein
MQAMHRTPQTICSALFAAMNRNHIRKNNLNMPPQNQSVVVGTTLTLVFSQFMSQGCEEVVLREGIFPRDFQHETQD